MRRMTLLFTAMAVALLLGSGTVLAALVEGDNRDNTLTGTPMSDIIHGYGGEDRVSALEGRDEIHGGYGPTSSTATATAIRTSAATARTASTGATVTTITSWGSGPSLACYPPGVAREAPPPSRTPHPRTSGRRGVLRRISERCSAREVE